MATVVEMPKFGLSMEEGTIASWLKQVGDYVQKGEAIAEVTTEKITNTVEAPAAGILSKIIVAVDETVSCGAPIALLGDPGENMAAPAKTDIKITPKAQKLALEQGIDYAGIAGTGIGGAITIADVKNYLQGYGSVATAAQDTVVGSPVGESKMSQLRSIIASRMVESLTVAAQTTMTMDMEVTELVKAYKQAKPEFKASGLKLSYTAILIKAVAIALQKHDKFRTSIVDSNVLKTATAINIGVAVDIEDGLVVPVLKNVQSKDLKAICRELEDLAARARENRLAVDEMSGGTMTITNLGMFGIKYFTPILNLPECAILGVGTLTEQPVVKDGGIYVKSVMTFSLTHDHRIIDGAPAARFLNELQAILSSPSRLVP